MLFYIGMAHSGDCHLTPLKAGNTLIEDYEVLEPGLPYEFAQEVITKLKRQKNNQRKSQKKNQMMKILEKYAGLNNLNYRWEYIKKQKDKSLLLTKYDLDSIEAEFLKRVEGRQLSEVDLQKLGQEMKLPQQRIIELCVLQIQKGSAKWIPAIQKIGKGEWQCMRCGEKRIEEWPSIYGIAATCPACKALGALSSLQVIFRYEKQSKLEEKLNISFSPYFELSQAQKQASEEVYSFVSSPCKSNEKKEILLWAACGAGKTEVCFSAANYALNQGQKVLFAAPRQDVVLDVAPRIERDFPGLPLSILTGVTHERFTPASFTLATTHQVLRFYQAFDLIFLDEIDAFPYYGNRALVWGLRQALKPSGKIVYLTATPSEENLKKASKGQMQLVRLPARHHRKPVPVPEWIRFSKGFEHHSIDLLTKESLLIKKIQELSEAGPVLVFVPKISWVDLWVKGLKGIFPHYNIAGSYSSDPRRKEKIDNLRCKKYEIFVSTSILERGVTIPNAQVIVIAADHEVFNERALVQMAGRVGRTKENPCGRALFFARNKTQGIEKAIHWIEAQNTYALKMGLIY